MDLLIIKNQIMKNLLELGKVLNNLEQQQVNGGFGPVKGPVCLSPYFVDAPFICAEGYHLHPQGHCICCKDQ